MKRLVSENEVAEVLKLQVFVSTYLGFKAKNFFWNHVACQIELLLLHYSRNNLQCQICI